MNFRADAEAQLAATPQHAPPSRSPEAILHELQVLQIELEMQNETLREAQVAPGLGIYDHDLTNDRLECDKRMHELWGFGPDEPLTLKKITAGVHPDDQAARQAAIASALDPHGGGGYQVEYRVVSRVDGSVRHVASTGQVFFKDGHATRFIGMVKDISAQKQCEKEMQARRNEMELLVNQQVAAQTAAAIAHELNQPLVSISAYSEAALHMLQNGLKDPGKLAHALQGAVTQAQRAGRTLHELLAFLHQGEVVAEPVDLNAVIREALAMAETSGFGGFHPVLELERNLPPVLANALQLKKVVVNLLHNGVEAMRAVGVPAHAITITVRTLAGRNMARVTVRDSGPGLGAGMAQHIFEPFFTTKPTGIGLGLAISRALIEAHGGQLWADPDAGPGATFHFTLPFAS